MPEPQHPAFAGQFIDACAPLIEASGGRAFLLYTSYRGLAEGVAALKARFPEPPFPVLVQGQAPREALLNRFRELGNAVLLATGSFWEGVDVKGEALSIVAIDKLPFASPDDPLLKARLEGIRRRGGNPFVEYQLPQAVLALKQGVGRLIRDCDDFGVIVLGDPRLDDANTTAACFLQALPPSPVITDGARGGAVSRRAARRRCTPRPPPRARWSLACGCSRSTPRPRRARSRCSPISGLIGRFAEVGRGHAERILGMVDEVLAEAGVSLSHARRHRRQHRAGCVHRRADQRGRGAGPGLRRGAAGGCRSPRSRRWRCRRCEGGARHALACLDARMGEVYWGCFAADAARGLVACGALQVGPAAAGELARRRSAIAASAAALPPIPQLAALPGA